MRPFEVVSVRDARQAAALLAEHGESARLLAGGTDLLVELKSAQQAPRVVIDISRAGDMRGIAVTDAGLRIGALVTHTEIMRSPVIREMFPALVDAAHTIGAVQTRNLGTLGGNLVSGVPSMDSGPTLAALDAVVTLVSAGGSRQLPLLEFFRGPRKTALAPGELLTEIVIPRENLGKPAHFVKFGLRKGQALALVNVAASLFVDRASGLCVAPRIVLGAVAPTIVRAPAAEAYLEGSALTPEAMAEAGRIAVGDARPISDFRASAEYRRDLIAVLTARSLAGAHALAASKRRKEAK